MSGMPWQRGLKRLTCWFDIVDFGDPHKNRTAFYLQVTALLLVTACALIAINYLLVGDALAVTFLGIALALFSTTFILIRHRFLDLAAALLLFSMLVTLTLGVLAKNGTRGAGMLLYPVIIIFASLILNRRPFIVYTLTVLASIALVLFAEHRGMILVTALDPPNLTLFITFAIIIAFTAMVVRVITEDQQRSLERAISKENSLREQARLLEASEARWRTLVANAPVIIAQCDQQGNIFFINYKNIPPEILARGITVYTFVSERFHDTVRAALDAMFTTGQAAQYEIEVISPTGNYIWYAITAGPVIENGEVTSAIIIGTNISKLKQAEAEIRALNAELDQRVRERTEALESAYNELELFSYTISHNLRTPARAMTGFAEMLMRENKAMLDFNGQERLRRISLNATTMG
ncbi:MAG: PAS domain S-box protein, partial [Anaerolineales bacterium]